MSCASKRALSWKREAIFNVTTIDCKQNIARWKQNNNNDDNMFMYGVKVTLTLLPSETVHGDP